MSDNRRLDELKRRVQQDPASIAFAALADEFRRLGLFHDAIETCRAGLLRHPAYLSARVTLGRALLEIGEYDEAVTQLEQVVRVAPDNLAAIRALADIHHRRGDSPDGYSADAQIHPAPAEPPPPRAALAPASPQTDNLVAVAPGRVIPIAARAGEAAPVLQVESHMAPREPIAGPPVLPEPAGMATSPGPAESEMYVPPIDPACERLEQFLAAIDRARATAEPGSLHSR